LSSPTADFAIRGQRPYIDVSLAGKPTKFLYDLGNDVTLINHETADRLGLDYRNAQGGFKVKGIAPEPLDFRMMKLPLQIGNTRPITIPVGIGEIRDNLLGREGVWENFDTLISRDKLTFSQHNSNGNGLGLNIPIQANYAYTTNRVCCDTRVSNI
jgi:hypothetical protein